MKTCWKNWLTCPCLLRASLHQFKRVNKTFLLKNSFNCESSNLIYVVICQGWKQKYVGETGSLEEEWIDIYRSHIRQSQYQQSTSEEDLCTCRDEKFHMFPFSKILQESKSLRTSCKDYFMNKFEPLLNKNS